MADAKTRAELEATQVELRRLKDQLAQWPEVSPERSRLTAELHGLEPLVHSLSAELERTRAREVAARDSLDGRGVGASWWRSSLVTAAAVVAFPLSIALAYQALDWFNWTAWAPRLAIPLIALPPLINGARVLRGLRRRSLTRERLRS